MLFTTECNFIASKTIQSTKDKNKQYHYAKFVDENGSEIEVQTETKVDVPRFAFVKIWVDIIQGQYPKYVLKDIEV